MTKDQLAQGHLTTTCTAGSAGICETSANINSLGDLFQTTLKKLNFTQNVSDLVEQEQMVENDRGGNSFVSVQQKCSDCENKINLSSNISDKLRGSIHSGLEASHSPILSPDQMPTVRRSRDNQIPQPQIHPSALERFRRNSEQKFLKKGSKARHQTKSNGNFMESKRNRSGVLKQKAQNISSLTQKPFISQLIIDEEDEMLVRTQQDPQISCRTPECGGQLFSPKIKFKCQDRCNKIRQHMKETSSQLLDCKQLIKYEREKLSHLYQQLKEKASLLQKYEHKQYTLKENNKLKDQQFKEKKREFKLKEMQINMAHDQLKHDMNQFKVKENEHLKLKEILASKESELLNKISDQNQKLQAQQQKVQTILDEQKSNNQQYRKSKYELEEQLQSIYLKRKRLEKQKASVKQVTGHFNESITSVKKKEIYLKNLTNQMEEDNANLISRKKKKEILKQEIQDQISLVKQLILEHKQFETQNREKQESILGLKQKLRDMNEKYEEKIRESDQLQQQIESHQVNALKQQIQQQQSVISQKSCVTQGKLDEVLKKQSLRDLKLSEKELLQDQIKQLQHNIEKREELYGLKLQIDQDIEYRMIVQKQGIEEIKKEQRFRERQLLRKTQELEQAQDKITSRKAKRKKRDGSKQRTAGSSTRRGSEMTKISSDGDVDIMDFMDKLENKGMKEVVPVERKKNKENWQLNF